MKPLFRWAGSKKKLLPNIKKYLPEGIATYYEPFCGSACLYFEILPEKAVLSDMNYELIHAYQAVKDNPKSVHECLKDFVVCPVEYKRVRSLKVGDLTRFQRAARFIYLNKLCFNGVYRTNLKGEFNVPMGTKTGSIPTLEMLSEYSKSMSGVDFVSGDFLSIIDAAVMGDFIYLDPPYSKPGNKYRGEYGPDCFDYNDVTRLIQLLEDLDSRGVKFALSYCECDLIRDALPARWNVEVVSVKRHVAGFHLHRKQVDEVIVSNINIGAVAA
jgi:DNA adenine methylase